MNIAVMGASGRTGARITRKLLNMGVTVRALGRSADRLADAKKEGARIMLGELSDVAYLAEAFRGADAVYAMLPYDVSQPGYLESQARQGEAMAEAIRRSGVPRVVFLSSLGADQEQGVGMIGSMHDQEQRLRAIDGLHITFLRPGAFFENLAHAAGMIAEHGLYADALLPDLRLPMVSTLDIADAAVAALADARWQGVRVCELQGPRDLSVSEAARIIGTALGRPDAMYLPQSYEEFAASLSGAGCAPDTATLTAEIARAINEGRIVAHAGRTPQDCAGIRFEDYAMTIS
jgi:uncharacterized protein YbjT (DUF2867 family)